MRYLNTRITFLFDYKDFTGSDLFGHVSFRNRRALDSSLLYCEYHFRKFLECSPVSPHIVRAEIVLDNLSTDLPASGNWLLEDGAVFLGEFRLLKSCNTMLNSFNRILIKKQSQFI